jgi:glycosyltransferase involved in cell wall biosynthesis
LIYDSQSPCSFIIGSQRLLNKGLDVVLLTEAQLVPYRGLLSNLTLPLIQASIKRVLLKIKPSIIHVHSIRTPIAICLFGIANQLNIPVIATLHSYKLVCPITHYVKQPEYLPCRQPYPNMNCRKCIKTKIVKEKFMGLFFYRAYMTILRRTYRRATALVAISEDLSMLFKAIGYENVIYLPNPVKISKKTLYFRKENEFKNIGFLGQLKVYKGINLLPKIAENLPNSKLHIAGWGPMQNWLVAETERFENLIFHGRLSGENLFAYIQNLDIILVPSICNEACPSVVLEAFARGKPVVCFDIGGQAELVRLAKGGLLAKPFSISDFCNKIQILISEPAKQAELGLNGRKWTMKNCLPEKHSLLLINIYKKYLK